MYVIMTTEESLEAFHQNSLQIGCRLFSGKSSSLVDSWVTLPFALSRFQEVLPYIFAIPTAHKVACTYGMLSVCTALFFLPYD